MDNNIKVTDIFKKNMFGLPTEAVFLSLKCDIQFVYIIHQKIPDTAKNRMLQRLFK